jgi:hypothetical protein
LTDFEDGRKKSIKMNLTFVWTFGMQRSQFSMANIKVFITEWKDRNMKNLPADWRVYHYSPNCPALVSNDKRSSSRIVESEEKSLDGLGFRPCSNPHCIIRGIELGAFEEGAAPEYTPDYEDFRLAKGF